MSYSVIRRRGTEETATARAEAARAAVGILRAWSEAFPQQYLLIRDENGAPLAYRRPHVAATAGTALPRYTL